VYFGLSDDAQALREGLRDVLATACTPATIRAAWDGSDSAAMWKELGSFGVPGVLVPEERGGLGLDELAFVAACEEAGYAGVPGPCVETLISLPELDLPLDGSARVAVKRNGPAAHAGVATHVLAMGTWSLIDPQRVDELETVDRSRRLGIATGPSVELPVAPAQQSLLGLRGTLGAAAFLLGLARRQVDLTIGYVKDRKQFGVAVGTFQAIKHPLADAVVGTEFAWPAVLRAAQSLVDHDPDKDVHVSMAKALASDAAYQVSRVCLQAHGAMAYTVEYDLHLFAKRTWALSKDWGTASQHRSLIAERLGIERTAP
jgi:alkylation response protein AidB-like acyl-CoA dehydrogenase